VCVRTRTFRVCSPRNISDFLEKERKPSVLRVKKHISHGRRCRCSLSQQSSFRATVSVFYLCVYVRAKIEKRRCAFICAIQRRRSAVKWRINSEFAHLQIMGGGGEGKRSRRRRLFYFRASCLPRAALCSPSTGLEGAGRPAGEEEKPRWNPC
jgi:hypothetical protein